MDDLSLLLLSGECDFKVNLSDPCQEKRRRLKSLLVDC